MKLKTEKMLWKQENDLVTLDPSEEWSQFKTQ